jgi:NTE family protein
LPKQLIIHRVAQYLIERENLEYNMFLGTPTGSLLVPHFATNDLGKLYDIFTNVSQQDIFSVSLFI